MAVGTHGESFMETDPRHPTRPGAARGHDAPGGLDGLAQVANKIRDAVESVIEGSPRWCGWP